MPVIGPQTASTRFLTAIAYTSFVPVGIATVLLGPMLPILSARWSLNYSQAGALFTIQYVASTCAVLLSGELVSWRGYRFAMKAGLLATAAGLSLLLTGPKLLGVLCLAANGAGLGVAVPAANLMVAELNPHRRSSSLNWLNFYWSAGAVACPFLVAAAAKTHQLPLLPELVAACCVLLAIAMTAAHDPIVETRIEPARNMKLWPLIQTRFHPFLVLGALFFIYVGTENGFGGWVASFAKSLKNLTPTMAVITPSFFYASLMLGRWLAPMLLRKIGDIKLAQAGLLLACGGSAALLFAHGLFGIAASACVAGLGLSSVYPITIALLSKVFGTASSRIGSIMFGLSNIGGGLFPWIVGVAANRSGALKTGLIVPFIGCATMFVLYLRRWDEQQPAG